LSSHDRLWGSARYLAPSAANFPSRVLFSASYRILKRLILHAQAGVALTAVTPPVVVVYRKSGAPRLTEKSQLRRATVGTFEVNTRPMS